MNDNFKENPINDEVEPRELTSEQKAEFKKQIEAFKKAKTPWVRAGKQNRNDLCQCGSGRKYKNCCIGKTKYKLKR